MIKGTVPACVIAILILTFSIMTGAMRYRDSKRSSFIESRKCILEVTGTSSLALSGECTATRALTEGLVSCLGDVPGGYCWHTSCDVVGCDDEALEQTPFALELKR